MFQLHGRTATVTGAGMERRDTELNLMTMCRGGGLGTATLLQRIGT